MTRKRAASRDPHSDGVLPEEARDEKTPPTGKESDESKDLPEDQAAQEPDTGSTG